MRLKLANSARLDGDLDAAVLLGRAAVTRMRALNQQANLGLALTYLATACLLRGQSDEAPALAAEALPLMWDVDWA